MMTEYDEVLESRKFQRDQLRQQRADLNRLIKVIRKMMNGKMNPSDGFTITGRVGGEKMNAVLSLTSRQFATKSAVADLGRAIIDVVWAELQLVEESLEDYEDLQEETPK